jgi:hypothetical protein
MPKFEVKITKKKQPRNPPTTPPNISPHKTLKNVLHFNFEVIFKMAMTKQ